MFKKSFFWGIFALVVIMIILRQSELFGLMKSTYLVFGWIPAQLAYDLFYVLFSIGLIAYIAVYHGPDMKKSTVGRDTTLGEHGNSGDHTVRS